MDEKVILGKKKSLISVIIPAYNAEKHIKRCINSIQNQIYNNLEIIVVNDGSNDRTLEIVEQLKKDDSRIIIINKNNQGVSKARNDGMVKSTGKYICFCDSDDFMDKYQIQRLHMGFEVQKNDMAVCGFFDYYSFDEINSCSLYSRSKEISKKEYMCNMSEYLYTIYYGSVCNKMFAGDIIKKYCIRFNEDISLAEDLIFCLEYLNYVSTVFVDGKSYYYYTHEEKESLTQGNSQKYLFDMAKYRFEKCIDEYKKNQLFDTCRTNIYTSLASETIGITYEYGKKYSVKELREKLAKIYSNDMIKTAVRETIKPNLVHKLARISYKIDGYGLFAVMLKIAIRVKG